MRAATTRVNGGPGPDQRPRASGTTEDPERVRAVEELLEQTDHSVDWVAAEVGFGNAATWCHHFGRSRGVSPQGYRRTFRTPA